MARTIPPDTLRRLASPMIVIENEDGTLTFKDDPLPAAVREQQTVSASAAHLAAEKQRAALREQWTKTSTGPRTRNSGLQVRTGLQPG